MSRAQTEAQLRGAFRGFDPRTVPSPAFVVDRAALQYNLDILAEVMERSGAKVLLALKGFSMFALAPQISERLCGTTASSLHEAMLGAQEFGGEVHVFAPAYKREDLLSLFDIADHIVLNSFSQWEFCKRMWAERERSLAQGAPAGAGAAPQTDAQKRTSARKLRFGIRVNPEHSEGRVPLYDPCAPHSRLGVPLSQFRENMLEGISGLHFHTLCEQGAEELERTLAVVRAKFGHVLKRMEWINLGGGHHITKANYNRELLIDCVRRIQQDYNLTVYIEPGEAVAIHTGVLVASVLDIIHNGMDIAIVDASATCHTPDVLEMPYRADVWGASVVADVELGEASAVGTAGAESLDAAATSEASEAEASVVADSANTSAKTLSKEKYLYRLGGQTCLSGDVFGDYRFDQPLRIGQRIVFDDMSHYTMVKTTTFNGIALPALCAYDSRRGASEVVKRFGYADFRDRLS